MSITKEMSISEAVQNYPHENIEQGALVHNIDVDALIEALNKAI